MRNPKYLPLLNDEKSIFFPLEFQETSTFYISFCGRTVLLLLLFSYTNQNQSSKEKYKEWEDA